MIAKRSAERCLPLQPPMQKLVVVFDATVSDSDPKSAVSVPNKSRRNWKVAPKKYVLWLQLCFYFA